MRKKLQLVATLCLLAFAFNGYSQRYLADNFFAAATVTTDVIYGNNLTVLTGSPVASDLKMDVYQPTGDVQALRPLVIVLHTGSFLPAIANGQATGNKSDSAVVEMCTRFAKRGYVAVAADYRLGWNSQSSSVDTRTGTLLNAVYRAIQDAKNCVRFFKNDRSNANTYKIDTSKIALGGLGSGGYVALAYSSLNKVSEIQLAKFINNSLTPPAPYVDQSLSGNFDGTNATALNTANYPTFSSKIQMAFNIGGAVGDSTWIEAGELPIVALQCTKDPNAPYNYGPVIVPNTGAFVVNASGSADVIRICNKTAINNNAIFHSSVFTDVYTTKANTLNHGQEGLYPFMTPAPGATLGCGAQTEQGSPWDWWSDAYFIAAYNAYSSTTNGAGANCLQHNSNPDMSASKARKYIDTIQGYLNPRIVCALGLPGCVSTVGIKENSEVSDVTIFPNPSSTDINFSIIGYNTIQRVELYDITGRMVKQVAGLNTQNFILQHEGLSSGLYITKITLNKGSITKKIIIE